MAISADAPAGTIQRGRGGFLRNAQDTPFVTDPSGALVKSGERKGEPKRLAYGSPSGFGKLIESTYNLQKWGERQTVLGIGVDLALIADCHALTQFEAGSDEYKEAADRVVMRAKEAAQTNLAADRGTHAHALAEDDDEGRNWIERAEAGELLGIPREAQAALVQAWRDMLVRDGLEVLVTEASCVDDTWRLAGTLDNLARLTKPLRFALVTGEVVTIPAETVVVLDKKTGQRRVGRDGTVMYWHGYAVQVASYAQSVPYDTETEVRGTWPWEISQQHALIAHLDVLGAIEGNPSCELVYVDLVAGREHGGATVVRAKEWERRKDVFSVGRLADEDVTTASDLAEGPSTLEPSSPPAPACGETERQVETTEVAASVVDEQVASQEEAPGDAGPSVGEECPPAPAPALTPAQQVALLNSSPDEGGPADPGAVLALETAYKALDATANAWIRELVRDAQQARVSIHLKGNATTRRFEIVRGLVTLAQGNACDDLTVRCIVASIIGDPAHFTNVTAGHALGSLDAVDAAAFARRCDELVTTTVQSSARPDGVLVLHFADPAALAA